MATYNANSVWIVINVCSELQCHILIIATNNKKKKERKNERKEKKKGESDWIKKAAICNFIIIFSFMHDNKKSMIRRKNYSQCKMDVA